MNYIKELNAFYDWLEINELSPSAINLWYALMHINNKAAWAETFTVAESVLCVKTGLTDRTLRKVRNELKQKNRIDFVSRKGGRAPIYKVISFFSNEATEINSADSAGDSAGGRSGGSAGDSSALNKLNKTKQNIKQDEEGAHQNPFRFFEENGFGLISPHISENISLWIDDLSELLVIEAMKIAIEQGVRTWKYVESILRDWSKKGLKTVEQVKADQLAYRENKSRKGTAYSRKPVRKELVPAWMENKEDQETKRSEENTLSFEEKKAMFEKKKALLEERLKKYENG
ncbi:DnaD domain-containing protein [Bacillus sp. JJ1562]|uniref:DnaD domain-containing protein n=1 Tax=Bacillus sp. JJ1562 TaxID=3122960 RepID=UPI003001BBF1